MSDILIPNELVSKFKRGSVALFIGAGCSRSSGLPGWKELLQNMRTYFEGFSLDANKAGSFGKWINDAKDYPRIAKLFYDLSPEKYNDFMVNLFDPSPEQRRLIPPLYYRRLMHFNFPCIITTNFDRLLEDGLPTGWSSITWQDNGQMPRLMRGERKFILHLHGDATRTGTLVHTFDEYNDLQGTKGHSARQFLRHLFEKYAIIFMGYSLSDPIIDWVYNQIGNDWDISPDWYSLRSNVDPDEKTKEMQDRKLILLSYPLDEEMPRDIAHSKGINQWFDKLAELLDIGEALAYNGFPDANHNAVPYLEINERFLTALPPVSPSLLIRYYKGGPPTWNIVVSNNTAHRPATDTIIEFVQNDVHKTILLTGAGGEGKSTVLMQAAIELSKSEFRVFYLNDPDKQDAPFEILKSNSTSPTVIFIDNAAYYEKLASLMKYAENRRQKAILVLASRTNEWEHARRNWLGDINREIHKISIDRLTNAVALDIANKLIESHTVQECDANKLATRLVDDSNGFLLAAMLTATQGKALVEILSDVLNKISGWDQGEALIQAIGTVVSLEANNDDFGNNYFCSFRIFREVFSKSSQEVRRMCAMLVGEISLYARGDYRVETRHPIIAKHVADILFYNDTPYLSESDVHRELVKAAGKISLDNVNPAERKLLTVIPLIHKKRGDIKIAKLLFEAATEADPRHVPSWHAWAVMEKELHNIGQVDQPNTARWLFSKAVEADPRNAHTWHAWAVMEREIRNIGQVDQPNTARWLFKKGTEANPRDPAPWLSWALMERDLNNIGDEDVRYTARWIFKNGLEENSDDLSLQQSRSDMERIIEKLGTGPSFDHV